MHWTSNVFVFCFYFLSLKGSPKLSLSGPYHPVIEGDNVSLTFKLDKTTLDVKNTGMIT